MSDYDYPKSARASHAVDGYDTPRVCRSTAPTAVDGERSLSAIPSQFKRSSDSSSDSHPISLSSASLYSADTSSGSLDSSVASSRDLHGYDVPKRTLVPPPVPPTMVPPVRQSEVNLDDELRKIDGLMEEVTQQRIRGMSASAPSANRVTLDGYEMPGLARHLATEESKRSSSSAQESLSSRSGSNDTLGVWDDVSFVDEESSGSDDLESNVGGEVGAGGAGVSREGVGGGGEKGGGGEMLDSWIKELESGMQGMSGVAGGTGDIQTAVSGVGGMRRVSGVREGEGERVE